MISYKVEDSVEARFGCLTPWSSVILKKLTIPHLGIPTFLWSLKFTPCLQDPANEPYTEPEKSSPRYHQIFLYDTI
jgi:hypothetical protein